MKRRLDSGLPCLLDDTMPGDKPAQVQETKGSDEDLAAKKIRVLDKEPENTTSEKTPRSEMICVKPPAVTWKANTLAELLTRRPCQVLLSPGPSSSANHILTYSSPIVCSTKKTKEAAKEPPKEGTTNLPKNCSISLFVENKKPQVPPPAPTVQICMGEPRSNEVMDKCRKQMEYVATLWLVGKKHPWLESGGNALQKRFADYWTNDSDVLMQGVALKMVPSQGKIVKNTEN